MRITSAALSCLALTASAVLAVPTVSARAIGNNADLALQALQIRQASASSSSAAAAAATNGTAAAASTATANASSASPSSGTGTGTSCDLDNMGSAAAADPNQSTAIQGTFISTCCVVGAGAICYTRTSTSSGQSCVIPSCTDLASGNAGVMNGFQSLAPAPTFDNPDPTAGMNGTTTNLTFSSYSPPSGGAAHAGHAGASHIVAAYAGGMALVSAAAVYLF